MHAMEKPWLFDAGNPFEDLFEESFLSTTSTAALSDAVLLVLSRIQEEPLGGSAMDVDGRTVYIAKTGAFRSNNATIPSLLIAYTVDTKRRLIRPILVCGPADDKAIVDVERAVHNTPSAAVKFRRRILSPAERTTIPKGAIKGAVRRALKRSGSSQRH
jgi:hypothetical protein